MLRPWWERFPERFDYELRALRETGIQYQLDELEFSRGVAVLHITQRVNGEDLRLKVKFPDFYPFVRFEVHAPDLALLHHQNPFLKNLCFIGNATQNWHTSDTVAGFLRDRLPTLLRVARSEREEDVSALEEPQGEPVTGYYTYQRDSIVLVDSSWELDRNIERGELTIGLFPGSGLLLRGVVLEIRDQQGRIMARAESALERMCRKRISGRWLRTPAPVLENDSDRFLETVARGRSFVNYAKWKHLPDGELDVLGVIFPEEVARRTCKDGWVFVVRFKQKREPRRGSYFAQAGRCGYADVSARIPTLRTLRERSVAVVGLGCLGAPSVIECAKAGIGRLRIMDHDTVEPGTIVRWPLGLSAAGRSKAFVLRDFISANFPFSEVQSFPYRIGDAFRDEPSDREMVEEFLVGADLLYDATAEIGIQHLLSTMALELSIPYVCVSATQGGWGGRIIRIRPGRTAGCWFCFRLFLQEGRFKSPPEDPSEAIQPEGCIAPTFVGPAFDLQEVALAGVRVVVSTLCSGKENGYPDLEWDVAMLSLRNKQGIPIPPTWEVSSLEKHPECTVCVLSKA